MSTRERRCAKVEDIWASIDVLAVRAETSRGRLALYAGFDQSTFTPARRARNAPSMSTILKLLECYAIPWGEWSKIVEREIEQRVLRERKST